MVKTFATLAFIGAAAFGAVILSQTKTVISGKVMAADLFGQLQTKGITEVTCDDAIPVETDGATFQCKIAARDGSTAKIEYKLTRAQSMSGKVLDSTPPSHLRGHTAESNEPNEPSEPSEPSERVPTSSDPWAN